MIIAYCIAAALWAGGFLLFPRLRGWRWASTAGAGGAGRELRQVSVIIPARDEAHNLPVLLESLAAQSLRPHEVIVVNDGSTDDTAGIARRHGATVIDSKPLPDGWRGKTWACHQGAEAAGGEALCFVDADTRFETPDGLRHLLDAWPGGAFSVCPWHAVRRPYEHLSLFFNLNMVLGTVPDGLFGPLLLIDRESYRRAGGHERVAGKVLENFRLAAHCRELGIRVGSATGRGVVSFRMYPGGAGDLIEGWTKGFASGADHTPVPVLAAIVLWMSGMIVATVGVIVSGFSWPWLALYGAFAGQVAWFARKVGAFSVWMAPAFPLALGFFFWLFARSKRRSGKTVTWKGREIRAD